MELSLSDGTELITPGDHAEAAGSRRSFVVGGDDSRSVSFPLRMTAIGETEVRVTATSETAYDSLVRRVNVRVGGPHFFRRGFFFSVVPGFTCFGAGRELSFEKIF